MDVRHRKCYASIKVTGIAQPIIINDGMSFTMLLVEVNRRVSATKAVYNDINIRFSWEPIGQHETQAEKDRNEFYSMIDLSGIEVEEETDSPLTWDNSPANPDSPHYDPIFQSYTQLASKSFREAKTPEDMALIRRHIETNYSKSPWWDGILRNMG